MLWGGGGEGGLNVTQVQYNSSIPIRASLTLGYQYHLTLVSPPPFAEIALHTNRMRAVAALSKGQEKKKKKIALCCMYVPT